MDDAKKYLLYANQNYAYAILRPIQSAARKRGAKVIWFLAGEEISAAYLKEDEPRLTSVEQVKSYQPDAVITAANTVPHFFPGIKVQVFHGFNARKRSRGEFDSHFAIRGFFDLYCTQGPSTTSVFEVLAARHGNFRVVETGWPKMDPLLTGQVASTNDIPVIMLTSTFTQSLSCAPHLLPEVRRLIALNHYSWYVQFHPKMPREVIDEYKGISEPNYQFIETDDVMPYLQMADVMVSDTSSILQEFMQLHKPVVTFRNRTPGPWLIDIDDPGQLERAIEKALSRPDELLREIASYNADQHPWSDGKSSERVLDASEDMIRSTDNKLGKKPLNLVRKVKLRKQLNYWKP